MGFGLRRGTGWQALLKAAVPSADGPAYVLASVGMAISAFFTLFRYPRPDVIPGVQLYPDIAWHIGNVGILSGANGFQDTRVHGVTFTYHYFSDLFFAIERLVFGGNAFDLIVQYQFVLIGTLLGFTAIAFFSEAFGKRSWTAYSSSAVLLFVPAVLPGYGNLLFFHLFTNVNAMALALPALMVLLILVKRLLEDRNEPYSIVLIPALLILLAGLKGPVAFTILAALLTFAALQVLRRGFDRIWGFTLLASCIGYAVVHFTLLDKGLSLITLGLSSPVEIVARVPAYAGLFAMVPRTPLLVAAMIPFHFLVVGSPLAIFFLIRVFRIATRWVRGKALPSFEEFLLVFAILSVGAYYTIGHAGLSQMYFLFGALPAIVLLGFHEARDLLSRTRPASPRILVASLLLITVSVGAVASYHVLQRNALETVKLHGIDTSSPTVNKVSSAEYEGLAWLQANTPSSSLFATNRHGTDRLFFLYSAYTGRMFYVEGSSYATNSGLSREQADAMQRLNDRLFQAGVSRKLDLARRLGIDYVVYFKHERDRTPPNEAQGFRPVFDNADMTIFQVL
jgi:hypothetical protein